MGRGHCVRGGHRVAGDLVRVRFITLVFDASKVSAVFDESRVITIMSYTQENFVRVRVPWRVTCV